MPEGVFPVREMRRTNTATATAVLATAFAVPPQSCLSLEPPRLRDS